MNYIIIIEDDIALSNGIVPDLKEPNNLFTQAYDIATAKEQLNVTAFDLMILDVNLPDGSGLDLLTHIRKKKQLYQSSF
ncbi:regulatory protein vanR [Paenibacillus polymyxa]|nr:regulatory protein vanR [Paenibacillus polymyxa]